jgi:hypothetical protein
VLAHSPEENGAAVERGGSNDPVKAVHVFRAIASCLALIITSSSTYKVSFVAFGLFSFGDNTSPPHRNNNL